jgi:hypothetical protein
MRFLLKNLIFKNKNSIQKLVQCFATQSQEPHGPARESPQRLAGKESQGPLVGQRPLATKASPAIQMFELDDKAFSNLFNVKNHFNSSGDISFISR